MMNPRRNRVLLLAAVLTIAWCASARADVLNMGGTQNPDGSWNGQASLEMVVVGNPGNAADTRYNLAQRPEGYGAVDYVYQIGKFEVTHAQWREFLNAKAALGDPHGLYNPNMVGEFSGIARTGSGTAADPYVYVAKDGDANWDNRPVNNIGFWDAARFCNWLHNGQGDGDTESGAYINVGNQTTFARQEGAKWWLPSEDEWYKAAYHKNDGVTGNYWDYPTGTNDEPSHDIVTPDPGNNANFFDDGEAVGAPYYTTSAGEFEYSESPYGTFDQGGNLMEWAVTMGSSLVLRGGDWGRPSTNLCASDRDSFGPTFEFFDIGLRVATVPEPGSLAMLAGLALAGLLVGWRKNT